MNRYSYLLFFALFLGYFAYAQKEAAIWYFGENAGLDFRTGVPVVLNDGQLETLEGCATISDNTGNLLFYTDGSTVWARNHVPMPNGTGLYGNESSSQSAIIVPDPGNLNRYYIFTAAPQLALEGINYSVVDMNANVGFGDVVLKNIPLTSSATEKLTAVQHNNGTDVWVITHDWGNDAFLAYLVTATGLITTPVVSNVGFNLNFANPGDDIYKAVGYLKVSPNGQKLAICHNLVGAELLDFDAATGIVSNPVTLLQGEDSYYGVEFSPSSEVLYISLEFGSIYQYNLNATNIKSSEFQVQGTLNDTGALQLAIDGKIYVANYLKPYLSAINNPNILGVGCNFTYQALSLGGGSSRLGLPPFIQSYFLVSFEAENFCLGDATEFSIQTSGPITSIDWDFGDGNTSTLEEPTHVYATPGTYTVNVTANTATETKTEIKEITIYETPVANMPTDLVGCTSYGSYNIDLPSFDTTVLGAQDPNDFSVSYFLTQADADNNMNALEAIHAFDYGTTPVYVRVSNNNNGQCYATTQFNIIAREAPLVDTITNWTVCDEDMDGLFTFDLSQKNTEIFNGQDETKFEIQYFASQLDADAGTNPLPLNYTNTLALETIFVRFQNSTYTDCFRTGNFTIEVSSGVLANTPGNLEICDDDNDGFSNFNLSDVEAELIGTQSASTLSVTYHESMADADVGSNPLSNTYTNTVAENQTIYARVENAADVNCYATTSFQLLVYDTPELQTVSNWNVCDDDNDGLFNFDFTEKNVEILGGQDPTSISIRYYEALADANLAQNEIAATYQNTANPQTIYYRLENAANTTCFVTDSFEIQVFDTPFANNPSPLVLCDVNGTGRQEIDLSQKDQEILGSQNSSEFIVGYYPSQMDAENRTNILNAISYENTNTQETLVARVELIGLENCYALANLEINIILLPQPILEERYVICPDSPALVIDGGEFETWSWQDANGLELSTDRLFNILELGSYQLTVNQTSNGVTCDNSIDFEVVSSGAPESIEVEMNGFSDQIGVTVTATGTGPFEYSVDGENYQVSNAFQVFPGKYTVYVRDLEECRMLSEEIIAIGYQRFFTPNGDGNNEFWNIIGGEQHSESQLYIYDRYGKFLVQVSPNSKGWDGSLNGKPLPASDYWFNYQYENNQTMTGHFTLKR